MNDSTPHGPSAEQRMLSPERVRGFATLLVLLLTPIVNGAVVQVFAAASLSNALKEIGSSYQQETGDKMVFNFGASSFLARQIEAGAPADIFFSADEARMDGLEKNGLIVRETRKDRLSNSLVVVVAAASPLRITALDSLADSQVKRVALADPQGVPAGVYSKQCLAKLHLWSAVEPKVVPTDNVRAALAAVESGNVDAAMVYKTDAAISKKVKVAYEVPVREGPVIRYPMAVLKETKQMDAARKVLGYFDSDKAGRIFENHGFLVLK